VHKIDAMLPSWLKAQEAVQAGSELADAFPKAGPAEETGRFLMRAARNIQGQGLNFYKRARFANAFKWRLRENGMDADAAHTVTQTLLLQVLLPGQPATQPQAPSRAKAAAAPAPENRKRAEDLAHRGDAALAAGDYPQAISLYERCLVSRPRDASALNNLGVALNNLGRYEEAEQRFRASIARQPNHAGAHANLGAALLPRGLFREAETSFRRALKLKPTDARARSSLGMALLNLGRPAEARVELERVLRASPRHADALFGLGSLARSEGRFDEAEELLQRTIVADPKMARAWAELANVRKMTVADGIWLKRAEQTAAELKSIPDQATVRYAIGKYFDDLGKHAQAFESYRSANELLRSIAPAYDRDARARFVDDVTHAYTAESIAAAAATGSDSTQPIFVVGMPRSGTSLIEQILASHSAVGGAGELPFWNSLVRKREADVRNATLNAEDRQAIAAEYLRTLAQHCPGRPFVVDKTPLNCDHLGLIHSVFPRARIIYARRDPIDTCLSCYFQHFIVAHNWALDLSDLEHFHRQHRRLMQHWRATLPPGTLLEVPYEELVSNPQVWTRRIVEFLRLPWEERCLRFHETPRAVFTASSWQVRQPLYRNSVERWRGYSKFIGPLRNLSRV